MSSGRPHKGVRASPVRHLREEALEVLAAHARGRIDATLASASIELIRIETTELLARNKELANGRVKPPPFKADPALVGRPQGIRRPGMPRPYWRKPLEERRPYAFRDVAYWSKVSPRLAKMLNAEEDMMNILAPEATP